jgi:hypothetical protein
MHSHNPLKAGSRAKLEDAVALACATFQVQSEDLLKHKKKKAPEPMKSVNSSRHQGVSFHKPSGKWVAQVPSQGFYVIPSGILF